MSDTSQHTRVSAWVDYKATETSWGAIVRSYENTTIASAYFPHHPTEDEINAALRASGKENAANIHKMSVRDLTILAVRDIHINRMA